MLRLGLKVGVAAFEGALCNYEASFGVDAAGQMFYD